MRHPVIALVRHGAYHQRPGAPSAWQPHPLTAAGEDQAAAGAERLRALAAEHDLALPRRIHCSALLRAWQTAAIIARELDPQHPAELVADAALNERSVGALANLTLDEIETALAADPRCGPPPSGWKADGTYRLPVSGAESLLEAGARVADHLRAITDVCPAGELTIVVGHGAAFRHAAHLLGALPRERIAALSMHHVAPVLLRRDDDASWRHLGGSWKQRTPDATPTD